MDWSEFARKALAVVEAAKPDHAVVLDEGNQIVIATDREGKSSITSLTNYWAEYLHAAPGDRDKVFDRIALAGRLIESDETLDEIRVLLVPRIRPRRYFEIDVNELSAHVAKKGEPPTIPHYTPLGEHLGIGLAIDRPQHIEYINDATTFGVPPAELDAIALTNIDRITKSGLEQVEGGLWVGAWGDDYAVERMLLPRIFEGLDLDGDPVVFLPGAEQIFVVGSNDPRALERALALSDHRLRAPRGLMTFPFVRRRGAWLPFASRGDLGRELGRRLAFHLASAYSVQRPALEASEAEKGDAAAFVASVMAVTGEEGELVETIASWGRDVRTLLPRTTLLGVGTLGGSVALVRWDDVIEICGGLLEPVAGLYPPRWLTKGFPSDEAFARLLERRVMDSTAPREGVDVDEAAGAPSRAMARPRRAAVLVVIAVLVAAVVGWALTR
ncbi:MAG: hypothetical protein JST00_36370 [Deltaproteobacteria bacterium]|nr:hypothetical protein [Deltaproteobacteria bacterium]